MSTTVHEQNLDTEIVSREVLIGKIRAMLSSAESGDEVVTLEVGNLQVDFDFESGEIAVYA